MQKSLMQKSLTAGQIRQILGFLRDVLIAIGLGFCQVRDFINDGTRVAKFKEDFKALVNATFNVNPYIKERVKQAWFYPKNWKAKGVAEQLTKLTELFPGINLSQVEALVAKVTLQKWHDGIAILPKLSFLGVLWGIDDPYGKGYGLICEKLFELIAGSRAFHNYRAGQMNEKYIRIMEQVRDQLRRLEADTPGDVLVLAFDFGKTYAGYSPRNARHEALNNNQLPLITAQVACLLLTMPDRLTAYKQLFIDCFGDEWDWDANDRWLSSVGFGSSPSQLYFDCRIARDSRGGAGSVVASLGSVTGA